MDIYREGTVQSSRGDAVAKYAVPSVLTKRVPRQVKYTKDAKGLVVGSDHGKIYVFLEGSNRKPSQILSYSTRGTVQAIATGETSDSHYIIGASLEKNPSIKIWSKKRMTGKDDWSTTNGSWVDLLMKLSVTAAVVLYVMNTLCVSRVYSRR